MDSTKVNNNRTLSRENSVNGINNGDDISNTIDERVLNIVGRGPKALASIKQYKYLTDHVVDTGNQEPNGLHKYIKKAVLELNNAPALEFKYEKQETKDMIKKCCDMYKTLRENYNIRSIIGNMSELINNFYIALKSCNDGTIDGIIPSNTENKTSDAESKYINIVECYTKLQKQIGVISGLQILEGILNLKKLSLLPKTLNKQQEAKNQQVTSSIKSTDTIKSTVMSLLVGDAVSKFLSEAKKQRSEINYLAIKELLLSLQRKINPLKVTDTKDTEATKKLLIRDLFYGFGVQNSAWELQESIGERLLSFSTEFGTINVDGKNFKIVDRGSELHSNCAFLSLKNGDQIFDSQTTGRDVKEYILGGAKKLKESLGNEVVNKEDVKKLLVKCITCDLEKFLFDFKKTSVSNEIDNTLTTILKGLNVDEFLKEFEKYKPEMFINGANSIYLLLLAIGMGKQIVIVDKDNKISKIFDPKKGLLTVFNADSKNRSDNAIYVCVITGHMMKLEQVDNDTNKASINTEKKKILSVIKTKIFTGKEAFSATKQVIKDAYEHFIGDDGRKCESNEFSQLRKAYDAITNQKLNSDEPNEQIAELMSEALVEIAILRPLYWIDYAQKLGLNSSMLLTLEIALTKYQNVLCKDMKDMSESMKKQLDIKTLGESYMKASSIINKIKDESKKLPAVEKFFI